MTNHDDGLKFRNANTDGQSKRVKNEIAFEEALKKYCPLEYDDLVSRLSYVMHLCPDTIKYSFLKVYFGIGFIRYDAKTRIVSLTNDDSNAPEAHNPKSESLHKCKNCDKPIPNDVTFCSKDCLEKYKTTQENKK
jgi:hypothetical protein